ncbi:MAG: YjbQ family protein, partial [Candidatus Neomarinimicrobiota bacterium]|nr:YjbQ family protein [Candidatus Neomarinimicrobiota bacterium]
MWLQKDIQIDQRSRGFHIITDEIIHQIPEIRNIKVGVLHLFIKHTSAS